MNSEDVWTRGGVNHTAQSSGTIPTILGSLSFLSPRYFFDFPQATMDTVLGVQFKDGVVLAADQGNARKQNGRLEWCCCLGEVVPDSLLLTFYDYSSIRIYPIVPEKSGQDSSPNQLFGSWSVWTELRRRQLVSED